MKPGQDFQFYVGILSVIFPHVTEKVVSSTPLKHVNQWTPKLVYGLFTIGRIAPKMISILIAMPTFLLLKSYSTSKITIKMETGFHCYRVFWGIYSEVNFFRGYYIYLF